ncbi:MAG: sensor histidine kinase, partial [Gammaproteobacteria bacterium]|nr:sensor histidine kinase [Gammaproteobacteria bacterium]
STSAHWFSIILTGEQLDDENLVLSIDAASLDRLDFYFVNADGSIDHKIAGDTIPFSQLDQPYRIPVVPFELVRGNEETRIFFRAFSQSGVEIPLTLTTMDQLAIEQQGQLTFFGGFFVFFFLCFCVCSILFYFFRDKQFLGYALFFGASIAFFLAQTGLGRVWIRGAMGQMNNRVSYISGAILISSICLLGQTLSFESRYRDSVDIVLRFLAFAMMPAAVYFAVIPFNQISSENVLVMIYIGLAVAITVFAMAGIAATQGSRVGIYLFCTWALLILAYTSMLAYKFSFVERSASSSLFGDILMILAAIALLLSLAEFVRSKNEEFAQARSETKAKGDFLKNVSREFLTPVHLILANSKRLLAAQSSKLDEPTRQHVTTVIRQSDRLHNLINDLLEMAELESDSFEPEFELVEMTHFLSEIKDMMLPSAMEKGLDLTTEFASTNLLVQTDKSRLQHVLLNVITNAIKFTERGNIRLGYKAVYFKRRLGIEIFIQDTGKGMSEEFQTRMFKEFAREDPGSEKEPEGTGLGMVIVKRIVEKLGGEITFESVQNQGSQFFIRLPLRENIS